MSVKQASPGIIIKDIGEITFRLFDHRPFLNGEINFFLNEFETFRGDSEIENLFTTIQRTTESKFNVSKCKILTGDHLNNLNTKVNEVLTLITDILDTDINKNHTLDAVLEKNRNTREKLWNDFLIDEEFKKKQIDSTFEQKKDEICDFYSDLEQKLHFHA